MISKQAENSVTSEGCSNGSSGHYDRSERVLLSGGCDGHSLRLAERKLVRLGDIAEVRFGIKTGANEFFYLEDVTDNDMQFSEIKSQIRNLGNLKSFAEIKKAGLRICRNTQTGDYWLIEKDFLRPVIKSPRECQSILIDSKGLQLRAFICNKTKTELKDTSTLKYIEGGEKVDIEIRQGSGRGTKVKGYQNLESIRGRKYWWQIDEHCGNIFWVKEVNDRLAVFLAKEKISADCRLYYADVTEDVALYCNSTLYAFFSEVMTRSGLGLGARSLMVFEVKNSLILQALPLKVADFKDFLSREVGSIFKECGLDRQRDLREQEPHPLPDRKRLDDIVFDAIGLTAAERKEVYWSVCELLKNRLDKAGSV